MGEIVWGKDSVAPGMWVADVSDASGGLWLVVILTSLNARGEYWSWFVETDDDVILDGYNYSRDAAMQTAESQVEWARERVKFLASDARREA